MLISVDGVTGIGKSTLQNILISHYSSEPLIVDFTKHPYFSIPNLVLSDYVLEREMIFMLMGYHYLKNADVTNNLIISDFIFDRFRVFAATVLPRIDIESVFYPCFHYLRRNLPKPDLVIHLVGSPSFVLSRIRARNRSGEEYITEKYLVDLDQGLNALFMECQDYKVVAINSEENDFLRDQNAIQRLILLIEAELPQLQDYHIG